VEDLLDLLNQTLLLVIMSVSAVGTSTLLMRLGLSDGVSLSVAFSAGQSTVTAGTVSVGLESTIVIGVGALAGSVRVGSELVVLGTELQVSISLDKLEEYSRYLQYHQYPSCSQCARGRGSCR
jgi:hypothetical protein